MNSEEQQPFNYEGGKIDTALENLRWELCYPGEPATHFDVAHRADRLFALVHDAIQEAAQ